MPLQPQAQAPRAAYRLARDALAVRTRSPMVGPGAGLAQAVAPPVTSYANAGGSGNRTALIAVSQIAGGPVGGGAVGTALFDGVTNTNVVFWQAADAAGLILRFDHGPGVRKYKDEARLYHQGLVLGGGWTWWGSMDAANWSQLSANTVLVDANLDVMPFAFASAYPEGFRYFEWRNTGVAPTGNGWNWEFEWKIAPGA